MTFKKEKIMTMQLMGGLKQMLKSMITNMNLKMPR